MNNLDFKANKNLPEFNKILEIVKDKGPLDAIVVIGHNWERPNINRVENNVNVYELTVQSQLNAIAGLLLFKIGFTKKVIYSSGRTAGKVHPSEAIEMYRYAKKFSQENGLGDFSSEDVILEEESWDTETNAEYFHEIMNENGWTRGGVIGISYHIRRANQFFRKLPETIIMLSTEDFLSDLIKFFAKNPQESFLMDSALKVLPHKFLEHKKKNMNIIKNLLRYGPGYNQIVVPLATLILGRAKISKMAKKRMEDNPDEF